MCVYIYIYIYICVFSIMGAVLKPLEKDSSSRWHCETCLPATASVLSHEHSDLKILPPHHRELLRSCRERGKVLRLSHFVILIASWFMHLQVSPSSLIWRSQDLWDLTFSFVSTHRCGFNVCEWVPVYVPVGSWRRRVSGFFFFWFFFFSVCKCLFGLWVYWTGWVCLLYSHPLIDIPIRLAI